MLRRVLLGSFLAAFAITLSVAAQFESTGKGKKGNSGSEFGEFKPKKNKNDSDAFDSGKPKMEADPFKEPKQKKEKSANEDTDKLFKLIDKQAKVPETERDKIIKEINKLSGDGQPLTDDFGDWFARLSGGQPVWDRHLIEKKSLAEIFDRVAERLGIQTVVIGKSDFLEYARKYLSANSPPWKMPKENAVQDEAEKMFRKLDRDGDGLLSVGEMPESLRNQRGQWDSDRDGAISLSEYLQYFYQRLHSLTTGGTTPKPLVQADPDDRPVVYRSGRLPPELPTWFGRMDMDQDGQIGLYEWRHVWAIDEFMMLDSNQDGLLTPEEMLRHIQHPDRDRASLVENVMRRQITSSDSQRLHAVAANQGQGRARNVARAPKHSNSGRRDAIEVFDSSPLELLPEPPAIRE